MKNPKLITKPFAQNGQKNAIPENFSSSMESNQATWDTGFGQITMIPVAAGGLPPKGQDFNGIFNQLSENIVYLSKGGKFKFSADYAAAINGYPKGAILQSDDEKKEYQSIIDNNKVNFNTATQAQINAAWKLISTDDMLQQIEGKQPSGNYAIKGDSYTKTESDGRYQPKGNYAPAGDYATNTALNNGLNGKFDKTGGTITGGVIIKYARLSIGGTSNYSGIGLTRADSSNLILETNPTDDKSLLTIVDRTASGSNRNVVTIPNKSGTTMLVGDYGIGSKVSPIVKGNELVSGIPAQMFRQGGGNNDDTNTFSAWGSGVSIPYDATRQYGLFFSGKGNLVQHYASIDGVITRYSLYSTANAVTDRNGNLKVSGSAALSDCPVGSPIPWPQATAPSGFLVCNGQSFNKTTYPLLASAYPSGVLPDLRAEFIRGLDAGRNIDSARAVLSAQGDAIRDITGKIQGINMTGDGAFGNRELIFREASPHGGGKDQYGMTLKASNVVPTASENRPRNVAFLYIVRAA